MSEPAKNEPAKKQQPPAPLVEVVDPRLSGAPPPQYTVRMQWIALRDKDITIGAGSLYGRVEARREGAPHGHDIWWSPEYRHYWIGRWQDGMFVTSFRLHEHRIDPSQEWQG